MACSRQFDLNLFVSCAFAFAFALVLVAAAVVVAFVVCIYVAAAILSICCLIISGFCLP